MISTEPALAAARLPPVPGLLDDLLLSVVRARQRRVATLDNPGQTLNALRVADATIDRALVAASLYGPSASQLLDQWLQDTDTLPSAGERSALVFVRVALALQLCLQATRAGAAASPADDDWLLQTERFATDEPRAVHDALRFAPVPALQLQDHAGHVSALLDRSRRKPALLALAIQLAGEREVTSLKATLETLAASRTVGAMVHHTLASMGEARHDTRARVNEGLRSRQPDAVAAAVRTACVDPRLADDDALIAALPWGPAVAADAWAVLICRHPRRTHDHALSQTDADAMDVATKLRISALAGYMDSTLMVCATLAERDSPITPAEADVLRLVLGEVPVETASRPPGPQQARSQALRQLVLKVCRAAHLQLHNDADTAPWQAQRILADLAQVAGVRVRHGRRLVAPVPPLLPVVVQLTHCLRQWLYIERAATAGHAWALDAGDVARRQDLALSLASVADDLSRQDAAPAD